MSQLKTWLKLVFRFHIYRSISRTTSNLTMMIISFWLTNQSAPWFFFFSFFMNVVYMMPFSTRCLVSFSILIKHTLKYLGFWTLFNWIANQFSFVFHLFFILDFFLFFFILYWFRVRLEDLFWLAWYEVLTMSKK